ncbi:MAG: magnesium chelatase, partial [Flavobacterium johnsoniae]
SGVSARLSITAFENLLSTAERRALKTGAEKTTLRLSDFMGIIPAITGKVELVYEGEQEGAGAVAQHLIGDAIKTFFSLYFPKIEKLEKQEEKSPYKDTIDWFFNESGFELLDDATDAEYKQQLDSIIPLRALIAKYQPDVAPEDIYFMKEFVLWGLVEYNKLSKDRIVKGYQFNDLYGSYIRKL